MYEALWELKEYCSKVIEEAWDGSKYMDIQPSHSQQTKPMQTGSNFLEKVSKTTKGCQKENKIVASRAGANNWG